MKYSEERISHLAHKIHDKLYLDEDVDYTDDDKSLALIKKVMTEFFSLEDKIDTLVCQKIQSLKKQVVPHSREWEILYDKYFNDELAKRRGY